MNNLTHVLDDGYYYFIWQPFVERFALWYWTVILYVCLSCLCMTLVYRGQAVRWIKMKLGMEVGLGPGRIVLASLLSQPTKGTQQPPIFGPRLLWPNGLMDQDATWYG